jgi:hypothetical protein
MIIPTRADIDHAIVQCEMARHAAESGPVNQALACQEPVFWRARMALMSGARRVALRQYNLGIAAIAAAFCALPRSDAIDNK